MEQALGTSLKNMWTKLASVQDNAENAAASPLDKSAWSSSADDGSFELNLRSRKSHGGGGSRPSTPLRERVNGAQAPADALRQHLFTIRRANMTVDGDESGIDDSWM